MGKAPEEHFGRTMKKSGIDEVNRHLRFTSLSGSLPSRRRVRLLTRLSVQCSTLDDKHWAALSDFDLDFVCSPSKSPLVVIIGSTVLQIATNRLFAWVVHGESKMFLSHGDVLFPSDEQSFQWLVK